MDFPIEIRTALSAAYVRAYHHQHDRPLIFRDTVAAKLLSAAEQSFFRERFAGFLARFDPSSAAACTSDDERLRCFMREGAPPAEMLSRARYGEDKLEQAIARGVGQYVVLGAGMDSFALRRPELVDRVQVFELDRAPAQAFKRRRLIEAGLAVPANLHFVPVDFATTSLDEALAGSGYNPSTPAFFGWLGVIMYLDGATVRDGLRAIGRVAAQGSELAFDYLDRDAFADDKAAKPMRQLREHLASIGEPFRSGFEPASLAGMLADAGFRLLENLDPAEIDERYFRGRSDGYHATAHAHFIWAAAG